MDHIESGELNNDFRTCLYRLNEFGMEAHPRGTTTKELLNYNISLFNPRNRIVTFPDRKTNLKYLLGEFIWYISGSNDPKGILPYAKFWDSIRNSGSEEGYDAGTINSNYGNRLFGHSDLPAFSKWDHRGNATGTLSQWIETVLLLERDKDSRQAIMNIHVPSDRHEGNKDVPCTLTLHWFIREDKLHLIVNMRSNDVVLGFTNDVFQFTMLQEMMAVQLRETYPNLELGCYYHNAGSMHIYDRHFAMAEKIIADERALEMAMVPMDVCNDTILTGLVGVEAAWQAAGAPSVFDFDTIPAWDLLTPYWQNLVLMCFGEDEEAMHKVFGIEEH
jgi:thymidylate synthase